MIKLKLLIFCLVNDIKYWSGQWPAVHISFKDWRPKFRAKALCIFQNNQSNHRPPSDRCTWPKSWKGQKLDFLAKKSFREILKREIFLTNTGPSCNPPRTSLSLQSNSKRNETEGKIQTIPTTIKIPSLVMVITNGDWWYYLVRVCGEVRWWWWCCPDGRVATWLFHQHAENSLPPTFRSNIDFFLSFLHIKSKVLPNID